MVRAHCDACGYEGEMVFLDSERSAPKPGSFRVGLYDYKVRCRNCGKVFWSRN